jgi:HK97 family phage portal protein
LIGDLVTLSAGHPPGDDYWYTPFAGGIMSTSGVAVTEESMMSSTAVLQAVRLNAEMVATMPLEILENTTNKNGQPVVNKAAKHPLYNVFRYKPNRHLTAFQFFRMMVVGEILRGNFYAHIIRSPSGRHEYWPLVHDRVKLVYPSDGEIAYEYRLTDGNILTIPESDMLHISGFTLEGLVGRGLRKDGRDAIGRLKAAETYGAAVFKNGAAPGGIIRHPGKPSESAVKNISDSWNANYQGVANAHRVAVMTEGMEWVNTGISPKDAMMVESMQFQVLEVARATNTPPHLLMDLSRIHTSNVGELARQWLVFGLGARLTNIEQTFQTKCFKEEEWQRYEPRFDTEQIQRPDMKTFYESLQVAVGRPFLSVNEGRAKVGYGAIDGEDTILAPLNMGNAGGDPKLTPQPVAPKQEIQDVE